MVDWCFSSVAVETGGGISRRKTAAVRHMMAGVIANVRRKAEGLLAEKRAVDKSVKIAVLSPT